MTAFSGLKTAALFNLYLDFCLGERESIWDDCSEKPTHYAYTYIPP